MLHLIERKETQPPAPGQCCPRLVTLHFSCGKRLVVTVATANPLQPGQWVTGPAGAHERCPVCA